MQNMQKIAILILLTYKRSEALACAMNITQYPQQLGP